MYSTRFWGVLLLATVLLSATTLYSQDYAERKNYDKVELGKHTSEGINNALIQSVIDDLDTNVVLADSGDTWVSRTIKLQNILYGYPRRANLIVDLVQGSFSAVWRENYGLTNTDTVHFQDVQAPDSAQVIIAADDPWTTAGCWRWFSDFGGGSSFYYILKAHTDSTVLRNVGYQALP